MPTERSAKMALESPQRIEPALLESVPPALADALTELASAAAVLGAALHPKSAASLSSLVQIMNAYYSNLIEGHNTRPRDIMRALVGDFDADGGRRNLQMEAAAHVHVQAEVDRFATIDKLPEPASAAFIQWLHQEFYRDATDEMLAVRESNASYRMVPGLWRIDRHEDVVVGRHQPPSSERVGDFMSYFEERYRFESLGMGSRILATAAAHHRFNYIHPFPDGNGRVSRLMSHAMAHRAGIGAHGLWSLSRGLARGIASRSEYRAMMDSADAPRDSDVDGRGNLSLRALGDFTLWFLRVCIDQVRFMTSLFDLNALSSRLQLFVERDPMLRIEAGHILQETFLRGEIERGEVARITGLSTRSGQRILNDLLTRGLLASDTPKGPVSLRFPSDTVDALFPKLFLDS